MIYKIQGLNTDGQFVSLELEAMNLDQAHNIAKERGLVVLAAAAMQADWSNLTSFRSNKFPLLLFNQEMLALLEAGLSIVEVLETLLDKEQRTENRLVLKAVVNSLHDGLTLSAAFEAQSEVFPELYIASVRASERSGNLVEALQRYVNYQTQVDVMRKKIIAASIYPVLLSVVGGLVVLFLMIYVIPKFSHIYAEGKHELPFASMLLMQWGSLIEQHGDWILALLLGLMLVAAYALSLPAVRAAMREFLWKLPVIGERMRIYQLSRFYRSLGMLMGAGIPVISSLERVAGLLDKKLRSNLEGARNLVREGQALSYSLEKTGLSTTVAMRLLRVGERSGQMSDMLDRIADFHEEELNRWIDWASRLFEPLLMTFIGIVIGGIVVLMYVPIFELAGSIQ